ncbi:MAG: GAF domain-containing protein [Cyclobacteriaceae bacterium]|jgi:methyl-accepting chemotaxis protein|nr:GAF domain-containing protein [Cyclobacteriaceae bacterium]
MNQISLKKAKDKTIFEAITMRSNKIMSIALWIYFAVGILLAFYYDTFLLAISIGSLCLVAFYASKTLLPKSNLYQYVLAVIFGIFSALYIYQMHGMFEMHFMFLVGSALLITYQNWKLQLPLLVYIVLHHGSFAYLQYNGMKEIYFTQLEYMDLQTFLIHATVVTVIIFINGMWAYDLAKKTTTESMAQNAFQSQLETVNQNIGFAEEISKGNLNMDYSVNNDNDELGKALLKMRENLLLSADRERKEKYITQGSATIGEILRKYADNAEQLANELVREIVKYTNSNQGSLFLLEKEEDTKEEYLQLAACYAYDRKKFFEKKIAVGESLVGQCFIEKDLILMTNVPQDYVKITSGLGLATPTCILLLPLISNEEATGVLEIASFEKYDEAHIEFLKKAGEAIASAILNVKTTERVKYLLEESQQRSEELRTQEEEMRQNMEELSAVQEQLNRQLQEAERVQKALKEENEKLKAQLMK